MDKDRIFELLARKMAFEASKHELEELNELLAKYPDSIYYDEILAQLWVNSRNSPENNPDIDNAYLRHQLKFKNEFLFSKKNRVSHNRYPYKIQLGIFCALSILFFLVFFFVKKEERSILNIQIIAGKGLRKKTTLPDGTIVWLNSDSKLSYNSNICQNSTRIVYLTGEAFFDVAHHKNRPFIVQTSKMAVNVLGTAFNVKAYPKDKKSEATLIRGSIELSVNNRPAQKILLSPSEKFALVQNNIGKEEQSPVTQNITLTIEHINPVIIGDKVYIEETSWKDSQLVFKNESFEELKPKLERWFNVRIQMHAQKIKSYQFTGVFNNENIKEALTAMQLIKPFNFKLTADDVIIY
ncbi:transmembrane sensor [Pedobacter sp. CG_S7]|uniref:FecR family protein n=1 Tax=Pedobacter sp. CG_S7 TaxID=3143930 RepID=UPI0033936AC0